MSKYQRRGWRKWTVLPVSITIYMKWVSSNIRIPVAISVLSSCKRTVSCSTPSAHRGPGYSVTQHQELKIQTTTETSCFTTGKESSWVRFKYETETCCASSETDARYSFAMKIPHKHKYYGSTIIYIWYLGNALIQWRCKPLIFLFHNESLSDDFNTCH